MDDDDSARQLNDCDTINVLSEPRRMRERDSYLENNVGDDGEMMLLELMPMLLEGELVLLIYCFWWLPLLLISRLRGIFGIMATI